jgi:hypothetical protein
VRQQVSAVSLFFENFFDTSISGKHLIRFDLTAWRQRQAFDCKSLPPTRNAGAIQLCASGAAQRGNRLPAVFFSKSVSLPGLGRGMQGSAISDPRMKNIREPAMEKPCSGEQGFPYSQDKKIAAIEASGIGGRHGTKVI